MSTCISINPKTGSKCGLPENHKTDHYHGNESWSDTKPKILIIGSLTKELRVAVREFATKFKLDCDY